MGGEAQRLLLLLLLLLMMLSLLWKVLTNLVLKLLLLESMILCSRMLLCLHTICTVKEVGSSKLLVLVLLLMLWLSKGMHADDWANIHTCLRSGHR
jgi:hypothetical protein